MCVDHVRTIKKRASVPRVSVRNEGVLFFNSFQFTSAKLAACAKVSARIMPSVSHSSNPSKKCAKIAPLAIPRRGAGAKPLLHGQAALGPKTPPSPTQASDLDIFTRDNDNPNENDNRKQKTWTSTSKSSKNLKISMFGKHEIHVSLGH